MQGRVRDEVVDIVVLCGRARALVDKGGGAGEGIVDGPYQLGVREGLSP